MEIGGRGKPEGKRESEEEQEGRAHSESKRKGEKVYL